MNGSSDTPRSKGMAMIAAYRAERLSQRPVLRTSLRAARRALRDGREALTGPGDPPDPEAASPDHPAMPDAAQPASVFANLVSLAEAERQTEATRRDPDTAPPDVEEPATVVSDAPRAGHEDSAGVGQEAATPPVPTAAAIATAPEPEPPPPVAPPFDPPLAEIGFGPGMLIRLSQLGLHTTGDLARADAVELRAALGDISRLVDVETWIAAARQNRAASSS